MSTTTNLNTLKINYLTQAQYDAAEQGGTINENELYLTPDTTITDVTVGGTSVVSDGVAAVPAIPTVPVTDVTVGGTSVVSSGTAAVPTVPTITFNGNSTTSPSFYAPTTAGTGGYALLSSGTGAPYWNDLGNTYTKLSTTGSVSADMTAGSISNSNAEITIGSLISTGTGVGIEADYSNLSIGNYTGSGSTWTLNEKIGITNAGVVTITGLATPTNNTDAATKKYVDDSIPAVPVTDVTVGGTSVVSSGTAVVPAVPTNWENGFGTGAVKTTGANGASGDYSVAEGYITTASGNYAVAGGYITTASGNYAVAEGRSTTASGNSSHAQNLSTIAQRKSQTALGEFNIADTGGTDTSTRGDYVVIVGNGNSTTRSNALTVDWDGNVVASGNATTSDMSNADIASFLASLNIRGACPYMVGDIYITTNSVSPETIWVGTEWDRIEDTFLLSAGSTYTAGDTGGSADSIVPYHTHTFTDHWKTYKLNTTNRKPGTSTAVAYGTSITASDATGTYTTDAPSGTASGNTVGANMPPYLVVNVWVRTA